MQAKTQHTRKLSTIVIFAVVGTVMFLQASTASAQCNPNRPGRHVNNEPRKPYRNPKDKPIHVKEPKKNKKSSDSVMLSVAPDLDNGYSEPEPLVRPKFPKKPRYPLPGPKCPPKGPCPKGDDPCYPRPRKCSIAPDLSESAELANARPPRHGPTISPIPDGTRYRIISRTEVIRPACGQCGFNSLSVPKAGVFEKQVRQYETTRGGKVVRRWTATHYVFKRCR